MRDISNQFLWDEVEIQNGDSLMVECSYNNKMMGYDVDVSICFLLKYSKHNDNKQTRSSGFFG